MDEGADLLVRDQVQDEGFVVGGVELVAVQVGEGLGGGGQPEAVAVADDRGCRAVDPDAGAGSAIGIEDSRAPTMYTPRWTRRSHPRRTRPEIARGPRPASRS